MTLAAWQVGSGTPVRLSAGAIALEKDLEGWIEEDPRLLDTGLTVVSRQMYLPGVGTIDLLCVDPQGRATVVEMKRGRLSREAIAQAIDYASAIASMPAHELQERAVAYVGADATTANPAFGALLDATDTRREVAVVVVGVGQDPAVDRMVDFLGAFGIPIRTVTFDVFEVQGHHVLVREEAESEPERSVDTPSRNNRDAVIARAGGPQSSNGRRMIAIAEAAERNNLFVRPYKYSLMITPPQNKARFLMNILASAARPGQLDITYGAEAFAEFFPVSTADVVEILGPVDGYVPVRSDEDTRRWTEGLDRLFAVIGENVAGSEWRSSVGVAQVSIETS